MDLAKFLPVLKFAPHVFFAIAGASGLSLFGPAWFINRLGLEPILAAHRTWIGVSFILSATLFVSSLGARFIDVLKPILVEGWHVYLWKRNLTGLSPPEKRLLAEYLSQDTTTLSHRISEGVVNGLVGKNILYRASNFSHPGSMSFDYNVQPWAWRYLRRHPELLKETE
jgi:hypothetical protein